MELQRSNRPRDKPLYLKDFVGVTKTHEPMNFDESIQNPRWIIAMEKEMNSIDKKNTWTCRLSKRKIIYFSQTQVYKIKEGPRGEVNTLKARFVTLDFKQKVKIDYEEMFVLVVKWSIVQTLNALAASNG